MSITPPKEGEDVRELWKKVVECIVVLRAIAFMKVIVEGKVSMQGQLDIAKGELKITDGSIS